MKANPEAVARLRGARASGDERITDLARELGMSQEYAYAIAWGRHPAQPRQWRPCASEGCEGQVVTAALCKSCTYRARRNTPGICAQCKAPSAPGRRRCARHLEIARVKAAARRSR